MWGILLEKVYKQATLIWTYWRRHWRMAAAMTTWSSLAHSILSCYFSSSRSVMSILNTFSCYICDRLIDWLLIVDGLIGWLIDRLINYWLIDWSADYHVCSARCKMTLNHLKDKVGHDAGKDHLCRHQDQYDNLFYLCKVCSHLY